ncbi:O-methyltransferase [Aeromonas hydrophila]
MSSGTSIPYHLRPNKAVERGLFIHSLRKLNNFFNISDYCYIGFGGPFLEDFKVLHHELKIKDMICIEIDDNVRLRQQFNKPLSCINFGDNACSSTKFINDHTFDKQTIVWLDYVSFNDLYQQLSDVNRLLNNLSHGDIFKITLNANSANLGSINDTSILMEYRLEQFKKLITSDYEPHDITEESMHSREFPNALLKALRRAIAKGMTSSTQLEVIPISAFVYEDGQKMLTVMGVVINKNTKSDFIKKTRIESWPYYSKDWQEPINITLPALSARERLLVEQMLPDSNYDDIRRALGFYIGSAERPAKEQMESFISYYRSFPWFGKVVL